MFCYNDAWFMNQSLAFHTSTNTFSNPLFDDKHNDDDDEENSSQQSFGNELVDGIGGAKCSEEINNKGRGNGNGENKFIKMEIKRKMKEKGSCLKVSSSRGKKRCLAFCDSFAFAVKSKIFVLELNFKRELRRIRKFASNCLPVLVFGESSMAAAKRRSCPKCPSGAWPHAVGSKEVLNNSNGNSNCCGVQQQWAKLDKGFWDSNIEPDSRETLGIKQEKILYRLEQVLQATRREQHQQQQCQQGQLLNLDKPLELQQPVQRPSKGSSLAKSFAPSLAVASSMSPSAPLGPTTTANGTLKDQLHNNNKVQLRVSNGYKLNQHGKTRLIASAYSGARTPEGVGQLHWPADSTQSKKLCIVCYSNPPNIVTFPCKHHDICSDCFLEIIYMAVKHSRYPLKCVLCRQKVERIGCPKILY